jgi:hypothetical protein
VLLDVFYGTKEEGLKKLRETGEAGPADMKSFGVLDPRRIGEIGRTVSDELILSAKLFCPAPEDLVKAIESYITVGATHIDVVTNSFQDKIQLVGEKVLPHFRD